MYAGAGGNDVFGSRWQELHRLDQLLNQLSRPSPVGASLPAAVRDQLRDLGVHIGRAPRREVLIAELWGRKRPLLRQLYAFDDPTPPCA
jgi:hypothetical protein